MSPRSVRRLDAARQQALSVSLATGTYAISFGALSVAAGLDLWQTIALSALVFSGGSQFAFIAVIGAGGHPGVAFATSTFLGLRNGFYGVALAPIVRPWRGPRALWGTHITIDESTAVALAQPESNREARRAGFWWTGVGIYILWNAITVVGAVLGERVGDPATWGLDAAAAAAFLGLVWPRLNDRRALATALLAVGAALAITPFAPSGVPLMVAALVAVLAGWRAPRDPGAASASRSPAPEGRRDLEDTA